MSLKIFTLAIVLALIVCFVPFISDDSDAVVASDDTFTYELDESSGQATVIDVVKSTVKDIPSTVSYDSETYKVVAIGDYAFQNDKLVGNMKTGGVQTIGVGAFKGASFTGNLDITSGISTIGNSAFENADITGNLNMAAGLTSIGDSAFRGSNITGNLNLPSTVKSIGNNAFQGSDFTGNLSLPSALTSIGDYAFAETDFTGNLTVGNHVTSIGNYAFAETDFTGNLDLGNSVKTIGEGAFKDCEFTGNINIPASVTSIGNQAFTYNSGISSITISSSNTVINSQTFAGFMFYESDSVTVITQVSSICGHTFVNVSGKMVMKDGGSVNPDPDPDPNPSSKYTITVSSDTPGWGSFSGTGTYTSGSTITISATPKEGYSFVGWNDGVTSAQRTITVSGDATYTAIFEPTDITEPAGHGVSYPYAAFGFIILIIGIVLVVVFGMKYIRYNKKERL